MSDKLDAVEVASHYAIKYGGLWKEFHQEISTLNVNVKDLEVMTKQLQHEKDNLVEENKSVLMKYNGILSSLTEVETSNLEHKQILAIIKSEKEGLMNRLNGCESQIKWLDTQLMEVKSLRNINVSEIEALRLIIASMQAKLSDYECRHREQSRAIDTNNQSINQLNTSLNAKNEEIIKLTRAIGAKDKQIVNLVKERNNLQHDDGRDGGKPLRMTKKRDDKSTVKSILSASSSFFSKSSSSSSSSRVKTGAYGEGINVVLQKQKERMVDKRARQCDNSITIDDILVSVLQDESYRSNETECDDDDDDDVCIISTDHDGVEVVHAGAADSCSYDSSNEWVLNDTPRSSPSLPPPASTPSSSSLAFHDASVQTSIDVTSTSVRDYKATIYLLQEEIRTLHARLAVVEHGRTMMTTMTRRGVYGSGTLHGRSITIGSGGGVMPPTSRNRDDSESRGFNNAKCSKQLNRHAKGTVGAKYVDVDHDNNGADRCLVSSSKGRHLRCHDENNVSGSILFSDLDSSSSSRTGQVNRQYHHQNSIVNQHTSADHQQQQHYSVERHLRQSFLNDI
jgi:hypothetical protein